MLEMRRRTLVLAVGGGTLSAGVGVVLARSLTQRAPSPGHRVTTSFGSVTLLGSSRVGTDATVRSGHASHPAASSTPGSVGVIVPSAVHGAWTAGVVAEVEARSRVGRPVHLSPGQFRVRIDPGGATVSLYSADHDATPLGPGAVRTMRIAFLAPPPDSLLSLEFTDIGLSRPIRLGSVGSTQTQRGRS